jgi:hypothetical protein
VHRCKTVLSLFILLTVVSTTILAFSGSEAQAATLQARLKVARQALSVAKVRLTKAQADLAALLAAGQPVTTAGTTAATSPTPTPAPSTSATADPAPSATPSPAAIDPVLLAALQAAIDNAHHKVKVYAALVTRLAKAVRVENTLTRWEQTGNWYPLVRYLAAPYHVNAASLYRMLMLESGGRKFARGGGGRFVGLFQYYPGTWRGSWNPWRTASIFSARAQIRATAVAIRHGFGPRWWPHTYRMAF